MRMNKLIAILAISLSVIGVSPAVFAQEIDANDCKDHPLISRMKNYYIASCQTNFDSFDFFMKGGQTKNMEGTRTKIAYAIKEGSPQPSFLQIRRNYGNAFKNIGGTLLFDEDRRSTFKVSKEGKETWIALEAFNEGRNYELVILEMEATTQEVTASPTYSGVQKDASAANAAPSSTQKTTQQFEPASGGVFNPNSPGTPQGSITLTSPKSGQIWYTGGYQVIEWTCTGTRTNVVDVTLWQDNRQVAIIKTGADTGRTAYIAPFQTATGNYELRVTSANANSIEARLPVVIEPTSVTLTTPQDDLEIGSQYTAAWSYTSNPIVKLAIVGLR